MRRGNAYLKPNAYAVGRQGLGVPAFAGPVINEPAQPARGG